MRFSRRWAVPAFVVGCIVLGGASNGGYVANAALQLAAIALLWTAAMTGPHSAPNTSQVRFAWFMAFACAVILLQFLPLPAAVWRSLPGRARLFQDLQTAGIAFSVGFLSLVPHRSLSSALWLLPAIAVLVAMMRAPSLYSEQGVAVAALAGALASLVVGAAQLSGGPDSPLYFYHFTNPGIAVGFFANGNHMATLLLMTIPFIAALLRAAMDRNSDGGRWHKIALSGAALAVVLAGLFVVGSLAGYGLGIPVVIASGVIMFGGKRARRLVLLLMVPAIAAGALAILVTADGQRMLNAAASIPAGSRETIFATTWKALGTYFPAGTGLGTFVQVYPSYEDPAGVTRTFVNHAHNDYLELSLELGLMGPLLILAFLLWWTAQAWRVWSASVLRPFQAAAVVASGAVLAHELVDYPLRTAAIEALFAACCALMASSPKQLPFRAARNSSRSSDDNCRP